MIQGYIWDKKKQNKNYVRYPTLSIYGKIKYYIVKSFNLLCEYIVYSLRKEF
jgi:hypothetical protein